VSFPIAHFPDAHFPDAHFPHDAVQGGGVINLLQYDILELWEDDNDMQRLVPPRLVTTSDVDPLNAVLPDHTNPEFLMVATAGAVSLVLAGDAGNFTLPRVEAGAFLWMPTFTGIRTDGTTAAGFAVTRRI
jgi:hypothetical protein